MGLKCAKCGFESEVNQLKLGFPFCNVCIKFAPNNPEDLDLYLATKIESFTFLDPFRRFAFFQNSLQKKGMQIKAAVGEIMSRPPFGYEIKEGNLVPAQNFCEVEEIFNEFFNSNISLNQLAKKRGFSVNGIKKILFNFTYLGKIKFDGKIHEGHHQPILSSTLFNQVQSKLEQLKIKRPK